MLYTIDSPAGLLPGLYNTMSAVEGHTESPRVVEWSCDQRHDVDALLRRNVHVR